jgi:hypothetical protein
MVLVHLTVVGIGLELLAEFYTGLHVGTVELPVPSEGKASHRAGHRSVGLDRGGDRAAEHVGENLAPSA